MIIQLNPALPMRHIEKGEFLAHFLHDGGIESDIMFTGFLKDSGEIWTFSNRVLRACKNETIGRKFSEEPNRSLFPEGTMVSVDSKIGTTAVYPVKSPINGRPYYIWDPNEKGYKFKNE